MPRLTPAPIRRHQRQQTGAAALVVVMILFFVVSMVAAYTNRNLIFEQRTSANQQRSTRALEAADAGVEWALSLLNTGRLTASCQTSTLPADTDFRQRYLVVDADTGHIVPRKRADGVTDLFPTCVYDGTAWTCDCPTDAAPVVAAPSGTGIYPAFRVRFRRMCAVATAPDTACVTPVQPGVIHIDVNGCTSLSENCLAFPGSPTSGEGRATVHVVAALRSALPAAPTAALTARGGVDIGASPLGLFNTDVAGSGLTIQSGGVVNVTGATLQGPAGTPGSRTIFEVDPALAALTPDLMFVNSFGLWRNSFRDQPAAVSMDCSAGCGADAIRAKVSLNPGRVLWLNGDVDLDSAGDIGSAAQPVLLNVSGNLIFSSAANVYGLVYSQAATWTSAGSGTIIGAAIAEGSFAGTASGQIEYNRAVLTRLRTLTGSFVRVPGTWKDFES
jgi:hypothetical protein